jgi:hypothetical protein
MRIGNLDGKERSLAVQRKEWKERKKKKRAIRAFHALSN